MIRAGRRYQLPAESLVPGDVVFVQSGDRVPADLRLFRLKELRIDEAMLTGESVPVEKTVEPAREDAPLGDRRCLAFSGTLVTYGQGTGVVVETGPRTEIGRISAMLAQVHTLTTPLMRQLASFARWLTGAILIIAVATMAFGTLVRDYPLGEMFLAAVGLAVAAIPEGLPAVITIALAIGVQRMARRNAIIRRLPAVETLGSVSVICSDKTGTLTRNEMTVQTRDHRQRPGAGQRRRLRPARRLQRGRSGPAVGHTPRAQGAVPGRPAVQRRIPGGERTAPGASRAIPPRAPWSCSASRRAWIRMRWHGPCPATT